MSFRNDFVWGAATASYQIEGATKADGRGQSVWDMFCAKPGATFEGHDGSQACDHYHRYREDIELMKGLGVNAYRFSIAWPRILPTGVCEVNPKGVAFYDRLVDGLLEAGIQPWATLFHWDFPLDLYHKGGWLNPDSPKWFADYAEVMGEALGDRVDHWMTQNEPQCFIGLGLQLGIHAPGDKLRWTEVLLATHNSLLAHGLATQALRASAPRPMKVGMAPACSISLPASESAADVAAARAATFAVDAQTTWQLAWWLDPVFLGHYPADGLKFNEAEMPKIGENDMRTIHQPLDFFGMNMYHGIRVEADENGKARPVKRAVGAPVTAVKWPIEPDCLYWGPKFYGERYQKTIYVTENGLANQDWIARDGNVHDAQRIDFTHRHLENFKRAAAEGMDVGGYFHWSLMDNFEWGEGYRERFGLIYVDYETQKRTPKDSYYWYRDTIASNGENL